MIFDHVLHDEENVSCVTCHDGVAHGKVVEQGAAYKTDWQRWTADLGRYIMDGPLVSPQKRLCIDCHELKGVSNDCASCHTTGQYPESHEQPDFMENHGKLMETEPDGCLYCHGWMDPDPLDEFEDNTPTYQLLLLRDQERRSNLNSFRYAKNNQYCVDCHNIRPPSHEEPAFFQMHGANFDEEDANCLACHDLRPGYNPKMEVAAYCSSCHPSNHDENWRRGHPTDVSNVTTVDKTCYSCHVEQKCVSCHISPQEKRDNAKEEDINGREEESEDEYGDGA
ncbi:MAG: hypothetical protein LRY73_19295 [Bacillus sp. (in: Bacteria)]|nr:hypothetical protein [Bacillus sp. (in: firmicutes)]